MSIFLRSRVKKLEAEAAYFRTKADVAEHRYWELRSDLDNLAERIGVRHEGRPAERVLVELEKAPPDQSGAA
ncbi:MAG: hypothetical protein KDI17_18960 [Halioglobus sp.]|nr:hypothetical protein [Halioglobus sp.]